MCRASSDAAPAQEMGSFMYAVCTVQIPSWELALPHMAVGEVAQLICSSKYAYGAAGAPPLIPPHADMVFEMEIVAVHDILDSHNPDEVIGLATRTIALV